MKTYFLMMDGFLKHRLIEVDDVATKLFVGQRTTPAYWNPQEAVRPSMQDIAYTPDIARRIYLPDGSVVFPATSEKNTDIMLELLRAFAVKDKLKG